MTRLQKNITHIIGMLLCLAATLTGMAPKALALAPSTYAESSLLSSGRWVKVSVTETGIHQIPVSALRSWGFSDPAKVKVYGYGARRIPDRLDTTYIDDLPQTPSEYVDGTGIVFYAEGPVTWSLTQGSYEPVNSPWTTAGYYFLSDSPEGERLTPKGSGTPSATDPATSFTDRIAHELEINTPGQIGHMLVGEEFKYSPTQNFTLRMTDPVADSNAIIAVSFVAKASSASTISLTANGEKLPSSGTDRISQSTDSHVFGVMTTTRKQWQASGSSLQLGISFAGGGTVTSANLNYISLTYQRNLAIPANAPALSFRLPSTSRAAKLSNITDKTRIWDVTTPLAVTAINFATEGNAALWTSDYTGTREYAAWNPSTSLPSPKYVETVKNQDLHSLESADMVIFTLPEWKTQADRLAQYRSSGSDSLTVMVLTPQEIYNEFSSGVPDAMAFRKLLKMLHDRPRNGHPLRYALFFSRVTFDNRRLTPQGKALGYPTMPGWFTDSSLSENTSYTSDDMFGFLADNSGVNPGRDALSIGVGRFPVTSLADATTAVDKVIAYETKMPRGTWKNNTLLLADDQDSGEHMMQTDSLYNWISRSSGGGAVFNRRLYMDAFELVGGQYPEAKSQLFRWLDEGIMLWVFIGHANPSSLTHENLVTYSDLNTLYLRHWPFMYAATCDFLHWDAPTISGAEILFDNPDGGIIGAISATRPVYISENGNLTASFGRHFFERGDDGRFNTIGDIYRNAKNDYRNKKFELVANDNKLRYVLMGDPSMRLTLPSSTIEVETINGKNVNVSDTEEPPTIMARQNATVTGRILSPDGSPMDDFTGLLSAVLYDAEESVTTRGNGDAGVSITFDQPGGKLYAGVDSIKNGRFTLRIPMPSEVADNYRPATLNLYAQSTDGGELREAVSVFNGLYVYGTDMTAATDTIAPTIETFYLNHSSFKSGDKVNPSPMAIATVTDNRAISISNAGVGHQMTLLLDGGTKHYTDISDFYTPFTDGTPGGTIAYPLEGLVTGDHTLRLRVWDTEANSAEQTIAFTVATDIAPTLYDIYSDANPATTAANFYISHDRPDRTLTVTVEVFDMMGHKLWESTRTARSDMFTTTPVTWDLTDMAGRRVARGIYLYRATLSDRESGDNMATATKRIAVAAQ